VVSEKDQAKFCAGVSRIVADAHARGLRLAYLGIGDLLSRMLYLCYECGVKLESKFASIVSSLYVAEGLGRLLDPQMDILRVAMPVILAA